MCLSNRRDGWSWFFDSNEGFTVASARRIVDNALLINDYMVTGWNRMVPVKVNVFAWKLRMNKFPSHYNLDSRGSDIGSVLGSVLCPICSSDVETIYHLFFSCDMAFDL